MEGRSFHALAGFFLCSLVALASCEGDDNFLDLDKEIAANAEFAGPFDLDLRAVGQEQRLTLIHPIIGMDTERTVVVSNTDGGLITGTFSGDSAAMSVNEGSGMNISTTNPIDGIPEDFTVTVEEAIVFQEQFPLLGEYIPVSGRFSVTGGGESVAVAFFDSTSVPTVTLSLNGAPEITRELFDFEDEIGSPAPAWEEKASLSFNVLYLLVEQVFFVYDTASLVEAYKGYLTDNGAMTFTCGSISPQAAPNPAQPDATSTLSWIDVNGNGNVDSGDGFNWLIFTCWENDARRELNDLLDGAVSLAGYVMEKEQSGGQVRVDRFGFEPGREGAAGVRYADFHFVNIREESVGSFFTNPNSSFTMNGGLDILFSRTGMAGSQP
ncbi:MAG TPA: hypothetical protein PLA83_02165 [Deltaproteobacteria bacterium]|jgi:hypothetical protein|nr:hypothetical protein [Deltaproteobacteria bacterium]HQI01047.1 hypothetical protein [Deltaproteobacteria bacterium]